MGRTVRAGSSPPRWIGRGSIVALFGKNVNFLNVVVGGVGSVVLVRICRSYGIVVVHQGCQINTTQSGSAIVVEETQMTERQLLTLVHHACLRWQFRLVDQL